MRLRYDVQTEKKIYSGVKFVLGLRTGRDCLCLTGGSLDMQWVLNRVTAMSGAAQPQDDFGEDGEATGKSH